MAQLGRLSSPLNPLSPRSPMPEYVSMKPTFIAPKGEDESRKMASAMSNAKRTTSGFYPATAIRVADTKITNDLNTLAEAEATKAKEQAIADLPPAGCRTPRMLANPVIRSLSQKM